MRAYAQSISIKMSRGFEAKRCEPAALVASAVRLCTMLGIGWLTSVSRWRNNANATA
jgi:hypothetical protein